MTTWKHLLELPSVLKRPPLLAPVPKCRQMLGQALTRRPTLKRHRLPPPPTTKILEFHFLSTTADIRKFQLTPQKQQAWCRQRHLACLVHSSYWKFVGLFGRPEMSSLLSLVERRRPPKLQQRFNQISRRVDLILLKFATFTAVNVKI
jgi:hypothetical protein